MAKKISLELEIGGVKKSVSNINELEEAISQANKELKGLEIGSEGFNKLSGQIKKAKNTAEDLNESLKGQDLEKRVGAYAKVGSAIVSSFAAANAAIALFGQENEDVAKAAAQAQSVLTIALTAREVAEGLVAVKTVAANIATAASAAAATAANAATRALYATLAANPYGAIIAAIGLVVGALALFGSETEKTDDALKSINATVSQEANELEYLAERINDVNVGNELRAQTIEELKKKYPGFNAFLDEENRLTAEGSELIKLKVEQYKLEAKVKAILGAVTLKQQKILENENLNIEQQISLWDELTAFFNGSAWVSATASYEVRANKVAASTKEEQRQLQALGTQLETVTQELSKNAEAQKPYLDKMTRQVGIEKDATNTKEELIAKQKKLEQAYIDGQKKVFDFSKEVEMLTMALGNYDREIQKIGEIDVSAKIVEDLKAIQQQRAELIKEIQGPIEQVNKSYRQIFEPPQDTFFRDVFKGFVTDLERVLAGTSDFKTFNDVLLTYLNANKDLNKEQSVALSNLTRGYEKFQTIFRKFGVEDAIKNLKGLTFGWAELDDETKQIYGTYEGVIGLLADVGIELGIFRQELDENGNLTDVLAIDPKKAEENTKLFYDTIRKTVFAEAAKTAAATKEERLSALIPTLGEGEEKERLKGELKGIQDAIKAGLVPTEILPDVEKFVDTYIKEFDKIFQAIFSKEQEVFKVAKTVQDISVALTEPLNKVAQAQAGFIKKNLGSLLQEVFGISTKAQQQDLKLREQLKNDVVGLERFKLNLQNQGYAEQIKNNEDLLDAYVEYKKAEANVTKQTEEDKRTEFEKTLADVQKYTQAFQQQLNNIGSLFNESFRAQQQFLKVSYENTLKNIVGDTEQANAKRLELQEEYEQQTKELEKRATLTSLRFSLAQAVTNSAQAITRILAEWSWNAPVAGILIGLTAIQTAAELAIINEQINTANMMRRGGLVKAQGGMLLSGPTHEQGGIPLAGMGVIAEGQEAIINRSSLINYRDLLSSVNQAGGGRPLVVNNFDDTRIVEAIASQRQKPLRAYVLESEITNEQALAKRLDNLSKI